MLATPAHADSTKDLTQRTQRHRGHGDELALVKIRRCRSAQHVAPLQSQRQRACLQARRVTILVSLGEIKMGVLPPNENDSADTHCGLGFISVQSNTSAGFVGPRPRRGPFLVPAFPRIHN